MISVVRLATVGFSFWFRGTSPHPFPSLYVSYLGVTTGGAMGWLLPVSGTCGGRGGIFPTSGVGDLAPPLGLQTRPARRPPSATPLRWHHMGQQ